LVKKRSWKGRRKSKLNTTQPFPYYRLVPHTIVLKTLVSKKLSFVVLLQYMAFHTLCFTATKN
jgi:hypothetical protein